MKQRSLICLALLLLLGAAIGLQAQFKAARLPSPRIQVMFAQTTLSPKQATLAKLTLLNAGGQVQVTPADLTLTLTLTSLETLEAAKRKLSETRAQPLNLRSPLEKPSLVLKADKDAVQATCVIRGNKSELQLRIVSYRIGRLRIFAEAPNFSTGVALFSVVPNVSWQPSDLPALPGLQAEFHFVKANWQQPTGAPATSALPTMYQIKFAKVTSILLPPGVLVYTFNLLFNKGEDPARAPQDIEVRLRVDLQGNERVSFQNSSIIIPKGESQSPKFGLEAYSSGTFKLLGETPPGPDYVVQKAEMDLHVEPPVRATALMLNWDRRSALASGLDPITITVIPVVGEDQQSVSPAEEGLEKREIQFQLNPGWGFQFKDGKRTVEIPKDGRSAEIQVFGKNPLQQLNIAASSVSRNGKVDGETRVKFVYPWWFLSVAFFGGVLARCRRFKEVGIVAWGAIIGLVLFAAFSLGALMIGKITISPSWTLELGKLPVENPLTPLVVGFFTSLLIRDETWQFIKSKLPLGTDTSNNPADGSP